MSNRGLPVQASTRKEWESRIARAEELGAQYTFAAEILRFYIPIARFQQEFYADLANGESPASDPFASGLPLGLSGRFDEFLSVTEKHGPNSLKQSVHELRTASHDSHRQLLQIFWNGIETGALPPGPRDFFARAFLQPYAVSLRERSQLKWSGPTPCLCPFCRRKPGLGVLRPLGDGGQRSLVCSFCLAEWEFRRIVCPGCGEEDHAKLPVYVAEEMKHVRVEACESCKTYIKTVNMTTQGRAEPIVDELAAVPLDVWARSQGYAKLQPNLLQL